VFGLLVALAAVRVVFEATGGARRWRSRLHPELERAE
jgi:hypothetical protein